MKRTLAHASLLLLPTSAVAGDVLLPDFTARTVSDFTLADDLTIVTGDALVAAGLPVVDGRALTEIVGSDADSCAEDSECPGRLLRYAGGDLVVVGSATYASGEIDARVWLYVSGQEAPVEALAESFPPQDMEWFGRRVADAALGHVAGRGDDTIIVPEREGYTSRYNSPSRDRERVVEDPDEPFEDGPYEGEGYRDDPDDSLDDGYGERRGRDDYGSLETPPDDMTSEEMDAERKAMGSIPWPVYDKYRASGLSQEEWLDDARIRTGSVLLELHVGAVLGDLDRRYDTRVALERQLDGSLEQLDVYEYETFTNGTGLMVGGSIGYVPLYWLDLGVYGGVQLGKKNLSTGWELQEDGSLEDSEVEVFDPAAATMLTVQPRVRIYLSPTGAVKPYVLAAFDLRLYDGYTTPDLDEISYPDRVGGSTYGPTVGGGLAFDTRGMGTAFIEIPWTYVLQPVTPTPTGGTELAQLPETYTPLQQYLAPRIGFGTRF